MAKIIVTGGAGFIGSNLVDELIKKKHNVVVIDDLSSGKKEYLNPRAKFYLTDICDAKKIKAIFKKEKPQYVFHLAAQIDVRKSVADPVLDNAVNVVGSINIFQAANEVKTKKIIFISTGGAIYGDTPIAADEKTLPAPDSPYAVHKFAAEKNLEIISKVNGLKYISLRLANIYGPRQYKGGEGAVVATFTYNILNNIKSVVYGDGVQVRDFVFVGDVVAACIQAMNSKAQGVFNIGTGKKTSVLDLIKAVNTAAGCKLLYSHKPARAGEVRISCLNSKKAQQILKWKAKTSLDKGIKKTIEWAKSGIR